LAQSAVEIVIDKSYLQGATTECVRSLCEEHNVLFTETLFYELLTTEASERTACFAKFPEKENPVTLIPRAGPLLRYENRHLRAATPLIDHRIEGDFRFNRGLTTGTFKHSPDEETALAEWRQDVMHEVEVFHEVATSVSAWCPRLRTVSGAVLKEGCEELKRRACDDPEVVRNVYRSLDLAGFASASLLDLSWVLFRYIQAHLLFSLDYIPRHGFADMNKIPKRVEHDIHDLQYFIFGCLCGGLATKDKDIMQNFRLACPEGKLLS
jgi:hypothetical protein